MKTLSKILKLFAIGIFLIATLGIGGIFLGAMQVDIDRFLND